MITQVWWIPTGTTKPVALRSDRGKVVKDGPSIADEEPQERGDCPYAHPKYRAAFILLGDPD
jgi:hypothetical protein